MNDLIILIIILIVLLLIVCYVTYKLYNENTDIRKLLIQDREVSSNMVLEYTILYYRNLIFTIMLRLYLTKGKLLENNYNRCLSLYQEFDHNIGTLTKEKSNNIVNDPSNLKLNDYISSENYKFLLELLDYCKDEEINNVLKPYL